MTVASYDNRFLRLGRVMPEECQIVGARGKHTRSWSSAAEWRVETSPEHGYYVCDNHVGSAVLALIGNSAVSVFVEVLRFPRSLRTCPEHGEYMAAMLRGGRQTDCPAAH